MNIVNTIGRWLHPVPPRAPMFDEIVDIVRTIASVRQPKVGVAITVHVVNFPAFMILIKGGGAHASITPHEIEMNPGTKGLINLLDGKFKDFEHLIDRLRGMPT